MSMKYVTVTITVDRKQVWAVPSNAILFLGGQDYAVFMRIDGKTVRVPVIVGPSDDTYVEILRKYVDVKLVVHLMCNDEEAMIDRIRRRAVLENRLDDASESVIRRRFQVYEAETRPVLDYYPPDIVKNVESTGIHAEVLQECLKYLAPVLRENFPRKDI